MTKVVIVKTGIANIGSVLAGFQRAGFSASVVSTGEEIAAATHVVVPGVGHFSQAMQHLRAHNLVSPIVERVKAGLPTLFVCVGLQLLGTASEEGGFSEVGLGIVQEKVYKFPPTVRVPQQGWNKVIPASHMNFVVEGFAYFSNSFAFTKCPTDQGWSVAYSHHGTNFISAFEKGAVLACQFHPELSGEWGQTVLRNWLEKSASLVGSLPSAPIYTPPDFNGNGVTRRVIPCLDVKDGKVVKGIQFQNLKESGIPSERAALYQQQGGDEIVILDVSATIEARKTKCDTVRSVRSVLSIPLTVGGGVTSVADAQALLEAGADKVAVNSAAVKDPSLLATMAEAFGSQCTVVAIDAVQSGENKWEVVVKAGKERTGIDVVEWATKAVALGAGEVLLTSWDRDGTKTGYDLAQLRAVSSAVNVPVIASGGAATADHLADGLAHGADAVLAASIFHYAEYTPAQLKSDLHARGIPVRTTL